MSKAHAVAHDLPYLRRYARALTGSQTLSQQSRDRPGCGIHHPECEPRRQDRALDRETPPAQSDH
jgi:hypothetical protein